MFSSYSPPSSLYARPETRSPYGDELMTMLQLPPQGGVGPAPPPQVQPIALSGGMPVGPRRPSTGEQAMGYAKQGYDLYNTGRQVYGMFGTPSSTGITPATADATLFSPGLGTSTAAGGGALGAGSTGAMMSPLSAAPATYGLTASAPAWGAAGTGAAAAGGTTAATVGATEAAAAGTAAATTGATAGATGAMAAVPVVGWAAAAALLAYDLYSSGAFDRFADDPVGVMSQGGGSGLGSGLGMGGIFGRDTGGWAV